MRVDNVIICFLFYNKHESFTELSVNDNHALELLVVYSHSFSGIPKFIYLGPLSFFIIHRWPFKTSPKSSEHSSGLFVYTSWDPHSLLMWSICSPSGFRGSSWCSHDITCARALLCLLLHSHVPIGLLSRCLINMNGENRPLLTYEPVEFEE